MTVCVKVLCYLNRLKSANVDNFVIFYKNHINFVFAKPVYIYRYLLKFYLRRIINS